MKQSTIGIIGTGNMGSAFYYGLKKIFPSEVLFVADNHIEKLKQLKTKNIFKNFEEMLPKTDIIILAIKPQSFKEMDSEKLKLLEKKYVISIMAGISMKELAKRTGAKKIVRSMPNLPIQVQKGVIGWTGTRTLSIQDKSIVRKMFSALGENIELKNEKAIDAITALSGSGPAYFFYLTELLAEKAIQWGFNQKIAQQIATATLSGSAHFLKTSGKDPETLRKAVTSKGGTTEAALHYLTKNNFPKIFSKALEKAHQKSIELQK